MYFKCLFLVLKNTFIYYQPNGKTSETGVSNTFLQPFYCNDIILILATCDFFVEQVAAVILVVCEHKTYGLLNFV